MAGGAEGVGQLGGEVVSSKTSSRVAQRQLALAYSLGGVAQRVGHVFGCEVGQFGGDLSDGHAVGDIATTVATGMRKPRMAGMPPIVSGPTVIRSNATR